MEKTSFFKTKAGGLAIAFIIIMTAFAVIVTGLGGSQDMLCEVGFFVIMIALLYSPFRTHILERGKK